MNYDKSNGQITVSDDDRLINNILFRHRLIIHKQLV